MPEVQPPYDRLPSISPSELVIDDDAVRRAILDWRMNPPLAEFDGIQEAGYEENGEEGEEEGD